MSDLSKTRHLLRTTALPIICLVAVSIYTTVFLHFDNVRQPDATHYHAALPEPVQYASSNYLRQFFAELLLIKAKVFIGGLQSYKHPELYADAIGRDFETMIRLHPKLIDSYFFTESTLAWALPRHIHHANTLLETGIEARPEQWIFPFFIGFNYYFFLKQSEPAIPYIRMVSEKNGPAWVEHLYTMLAAENGEILASLVSLKAIYNNEKDSKMKQRYRDEISDFEYALLVQQAINRYVADNKNKYPDNLDVLVPKYLDKIIWKGHYNELHYEKHHLFLSRIQKKRPEK